MFTWATLCGSSTGPETVLRFNLREVARLCSRVDNGSWFALLDRHLGYEQERKVQCSGYESGRAGVDLWAERHCERIAREVEVWELAHPPHRAIRGTKWSKIGVK